jgi:hypothetical protein
MHYDLLKHQEPFSQPHSVTSQYISIPSLHFINTKLHKGNICHGRSNQLEVCPRYPRAIRSKTYRGYMKPRINPNAIYNVIFV